MKRYFNSFFITLFIYATLALLFFYSMSTIKVNSVKSENKISINNILLKEEKVVNKKVKKQEKKKIEKKVIKEKKRKIVKKEKKKKIVKKDKKKIVKKEKNNIEKKEPLKENKIEKTNNKEVKKIAEVKKQTSKKSYEKEFINKNLQKIIALIKKNIIYPKRARKRHIEGLVVIEFLLNIDAKIEKFKIIKGNKLLSKATIKAINNALKDFPKVKKDLHLRVPILYKLN